MPLKLPVFNFSTKQSGDVLDIYIDGAIVDAESEQILKDYFGDDTSVSYKSFRNSVETAKPKKLNIYVNSVGGHAGDSLAMHDYIQQLQKDGTVVNVYVRGMSASAATYFQLAVPMANRFATQNSFGLIHNVSGGVYGDLRTVQNYASMMDKMNKNIVNLYVSNTKLTHQKVTDMMDAETLLTADEMLNYGFVGNITGKEDVKNTVDLSALHFKNQAVLNTLKNFSPQNTTEMDVQKITDAIKNGFNALLDKAGLKDKKDDEAVKNAFTEFSKSITDALTQAAPSEDTVKALVNTAFADALKTLGENEAFKNAITEATKNSLTKDDIKDFLKKDDIKDVVNKKDLTEFQTTLTNAIAEKMGNKGGGKTKEEEKNEKRTTPRNRFSGVEFWTAEN